MIVSRWRRFARGTPERSSSTRPVGPIRSDEEAIGVASAVIDEMIAIVLSGRPVNVLQREGWPAGLSIDGNVAMMRIHRYLDHLERPVLSPQRRSTGFNDSTRPKRLRRASDHPTGPTTDG